MREVMTRVLPVPAPARIRTGPSNRLDGLSLLRVERAQIEHRARSLGEREVNARGYSGREKSEA